MYDMNVYDEVYQVAYGIIMYGAGMFVILNKTMQGPYTCMAHNLNFHNFLVFYTLSIYYTDLSLCFLLFKQLPLVAKTVNQCVGRSL